MSAVLAAYGGMTIALQAVLLYRLIGYWAVLLTGTICYLSLWRRRSLVTPASGAVARTCRGLGRVHEVSPFPKEPGFGSDSRTYRSDDQFPARRRSPHESYGRNDNSPRLLRSRLPAIQATAGRRGEREAA